MVRLTVAFATAAHAEYGLAFIDRANLEVRQASPHRGGVGGDVIQLDLDVTARDESRLQTVLLGVNAFVLTPLQAS